MSQSLKFFSFAVPIINSACVDSSQASPFRAAARRSGQAPRQVQVVAELRHRDIHAQNNWPDTHS